MIGEIMMIISGILSCIFGSILVVLGFKKVCRYRKHIAILGVEEHNLDE